MRNEATLESLGKRLTHLWRRDLEGSQAIEITQLIMSLDTCAEKIGKKWEQTQKLPEL